MKCHYACRSADHQIARRHFLGNVVAGGGATLAGLGALAHPSVARQLTSTQRRVLCIFLAGGSSQFETWDPKPGTDTGGPFRAIPTSVPGTHICELLPMTAQWMHRISLIRSINTNENEHGRGRHMVETGRVRMPGTEFPHLGAVTARAVHHEASELPGHIRVASRAGARSSDAAYLGPEFASISVGVDGGLRNSELPKGVTASLDLQRQQWRRDADHRFLARRRSAETDVYTQSYEQAISLMRRRQLFDIAKEPAGMLERYGDYDFGKQCLMARRLLESGITFVQVSHSNYDTHNENFNFHLEQLGEFDKTFSALIEDLARRGMLESTLVLVLSEFGRTPRINHKFGRDHWGKSWSVAMAGCGVQDGAIIGATNKDGTEVADREVDHRHLFHTFLQAAGVDSTKEFHVDGRAVPVADPSGEPIRELLA